jgi:chemotaxis signal transduction protein
MTSAQQAILAERARILALPRDRSASATDADLEGVLVFFVGEEKLAISLSSIVAIIRAGEVTPLPRAVAPVFGVTAWRGRPLTVLALDASRAEGPRQLIVLGDERRAALGLLADEVEETRLIARSTLSPAPAGRRAALAVGMTDDALLVLDATALINAARPEL